MNKKRYLASILMILSGLSFSLPAFALDKEPGLADEAANDSIEVSDFENFEVVEIVVDGESPVTEAEEDEQAPEEDDCGFNVPEDKNYGAE